MKRLANAVGSRYLSFQNPRVVSPPGRVASNGARNIMVATPMRSGTHLMIDAILNNIPAYCRTPLYVDLDQFYKQGERSDADFGDLGPTSGYLLKTHFPLGFPRPSDHAAKVAELARGALVITVERRPEDVKASLLRWAGNDAGSAALDGYIAGIDANLDAFWSIWRDRSDIALNFEELFDPSCMTKVVAQVARDLGVSACARYHPMPPKRQMNRIYLQKGLTRLLGRHAPRINTTIYVAG